MRTLIVIVVGALLAGCSTFGMSAARVAEMDQNKCASYGFRPGTDAYASCMQNIELARQEDDRIRRSAFRAAGANLLNSGNSVTCNSVGTSFGSVRNTTTTCR